MIAVVIALVGLAFAVRQLIKDVRYDVFTPGGTVLPVAVLSVLAICTGVVVGLLVSIPSSTDRLVQTQELEPFEGSYVSAVGSDYVYRTDGTLYTTPSKTTTVLFDDGPARVETWYSEAPWWALPPIAPLTQENVIYVPLD